jgi:hypothetical protein
MAKKKCIIAQSQLEWDSCIAGLTAFAMDAGVIPLPLSYI